MQDRPTGPDALRERVFAGRARRNAQQRRTAAAKKGSRRIIAVATALATVAGIIVATTLVSNAGVWRNRGDGGPCVTTPSESASPPAPAESEEGDDVTSTEELEAHTTVEDGVTHVHYGPPRDRDRDRRWWRDRDRDRRWDRDEPTCTPSPSTDPTTSPDESTDPTSDPTSDPGESPDPSESPEPSASPTGPPPLDIVTTDCTAGGNENLAPHTGFQAEQAQCVSTAAGAVTALQDNPSVLITEFPDTVGVNQPFSFTISFRNLLRDRFLGAAAGGYYAEASFLTEDGVQHGHAHVGILDIGDASEAPTPDALNAPAFFRALEDQQGGRGVDFVEFEVPDGIATPGNFRVMVWCGDPSHRIPMMSFADEQPCVDTVRITVE